MFKVFLTNKPFVFFFIFFTILNYSMAQTPGSPEPEENIYFNYLSVNNGLSQSSVTSIINDSKGFIWIGTYDGLNRFDGFNILTKRHESNNKNSLSDNRILCLYDNNKNILIGTDGGGLNIFESQQNNFEHIKAEDGLLSDIILSVCSDKTGNFWVGSDRGLTVITRYNHKPVKKNFLYPAALKNKNIRKLFCDKDDNIWAGTDEGLYLCTKSMVSNHLVVHFKKINEVGNSIVTAIYQDKRNNIWIGKSGELYRINLEKNAPENSISVKSLYKDAFPENIGSINIGSITEDLNGNLWIGSENSGIYKLHFDSQGEIIQRDKYNSKRPYCNISEDMISVVFVDFSNTLWVGTFQKGVNFSSVSDKNFFTFNLLTSSQINELGYAGKYVTSVLDLDNNLWIGTSKYGLFLYNKSTRKLYNHFEEIHSRNINSIFSDRHKNIWVCSENGLHKMDYVRNGYSKVKTIKSGFVARSACEDKLGNIWVTTFDGLTIYNPKDKTFKTLTVQNGLSSNRTYFIYSDPFDPVIWVSTLGGGLNKVEYSDNAKFKITHYSYQQGNPETLTSNHVWSIYRDMNQILWVGTDAGLNKIIPGKSSAKIYHINNSLIKDKKIMAILEDDEKNLWLSSSRGLIRYNTLTEKAKKYTYRDGLQSNTLTEAACKTQDGWFYFGGINGLNYFKPEKIKENIYPSRIALIDFKIYNQTIQPGQKLNGRIVLKKNINAVDTITLSYKQNNFLLTFASLHYAVPEDNKFRYKLAGYDKNWVSTDYTQRFAAYSNLEAGEYKFLITSSNNDDIFNKSIKTITIIMEPAPWATWWAKTIYFLIFSSIVIIIFNYYKTKHEIKKQLFEEKIEKEKVIELNEIKLNFFTNITHELRTPLNLIFGPLQDLLHKTSGYDQYTRLRVELVHRNALRLFNLINQILDLRKISSENQKLAISHNNLIQTIAAIKDSFSWPAEQKNIQFLFSHEENKVMAWFDKDKIEKIIFNLMSNAFKYTLENGFIDINLSVKDSGDNLYAEISVKDSGPGIDNEDQEKIFDAFYQGKKQTNIGSGIGLALSKKLIEMHYGEIKVNKNEYQGSTFTISFPINRKSYQEEDILTLSSCEHAEDCPKIKKVVLPEKIATKHTVLLIEDNEDQRIYIKDSICEHFNIIEAENGLSGFEMATRSQPDIILTDIMMPGLNGFELCRKIKSDIKTNHIPVLIHSVKNTGVSLLDALNAGADDFIAKPYNYSMLILKMDNIIRSRNQLLTHVYKEKILTPAELNIPSEDEELLKKIVKVIELNMSDVKFNVEKLSQEVCMSRMNLHRKLHAIIGKTASEFIREVRMKRAGQLLSSRSRRISEVMFEVGILSNVHFNRYFKDMYGKLPKDFIKELNNTAGENHIN